MTSLEEKLGRYAKPSSNNEKEKQDRAERMVRNAVKQWANEQKVSVSYLPKGSYANNTNVRLDSDVDIAVIHKGFHYLDDSALRPEHRHSERSATSNYLKGTEFRRSLGTSLEARFGKACDNSGKTAIELAENTGRVKTDIVPSFAFRKYEYNLFGMVAYHEGTKVFRLDGTAVIDYPEQQLVNGRKKNAATGGRYKRLVRILKRTENDLSEAKEINPLPSYFMECLMYIVPNDRFGHISFNPLTLDLVHAASYILGRVKAYSDTSKLREPNGIKSLFGEGQPWSVKDARMLIEATLDRYGLVRK